MRSHSIDVCSAIYGWINRLTGYAQIHLFREVAGSAHEPFTKTENGCLFVHPNRRTHVFLS